MKFQTFFLCLMISTSTFAEANSNTSIACKPLIGNGLSAKFVFDDFSEEYSTVTVFRDQRKLFSITRSREVSYCLESDLSAGSDTEGSFRDIIVLIKAHELPGCTGPFHSAQLRARGSMSGQVRGDLTVSFKGQIFVQKVICSLSPH